MREDLLRQLECLKFISRRILTHVRPRVTTSFVIGNYTITAHAGPVYGETDLSDNKRAISPVKITIPGDINGDFFVNIKDASQIGIYWQQNSPPAPANVDINGDGKITIMDATIIGVNWQKHT